MRRSLANTFIYALLYVPLGTVVALGLALLLHRVGRAAGFFRTAFYLPVMTPAVAAGAMFLLLLNGQRGLVNQVLGWVGIEGPNWTTDPALDQALAGRGQPLGASAAASSSTSPRCRTSPASCTRRRMLDGAGPVRRFFSVTVPMISGAIFFSVITHTIAALQMFDQAYTMFYGPQQKATASDASLVYMVYLFQNAFQFFKMGFASAMAWVLFLIILVVTVVQVRVGNRFVYYEGAAAMTASTTPAPRVTPGPGRPADRRRRSSGRRHGAQPRRRPGLAGPLPRWPCSCATLAFVYPLVWLVSAALKPKEQVFDNRLVPEDVQWSNFVEVFSTPGRCSSGSSTR